MDKNRTIVVGMRLKWIKKISGSYGCEMELNNIVVGNTCEIDLKA